MRLVLLSLGAAMLWSGCGNNATMEENEAESVTKPDAEDRTFAEDVEFLQQVTESFVLGSGDGKIVVTPEYQGRVMTSTTGGPKGLSFGWLNYDLINEGITPPGEAPKHIHPFGGEDRFWLGPEGGQFAIFFQPGTDFVFEDWYTPPVIDTEPFNLESQDQNSAVFTREFNLTNWTGTVLSGAIRRQISVLDREEIAGNLGVELPDSIRQVGYQTENDLTNTGDSAWTRESGALSIWILGMYKPSPSTVVAIPFKAGPESELGPRVNDTYFGKVPADRLVVKEDILYFSGDGEYRSKIGINPRRSKGIAASYDPLNGVLNIVTYNMPEPGLPYVNSMWEHQEEPYAGDALNSYNDGPPEPGAAPLGPFYELETSSPAALLEPGASLTHIQHTYHLQGDETALDPIARKLLGVGLEDIKTALP